MVSVQNVVIIRKMFLCVTSAGWKWVSVTIRSMVAMKINKRDHLTKWSHGVILQYDEKHTTNNGE